MSDDNDKINLLVDKLQVLLNRQNVMSRDIDQLREEISKLKDSMATQNTEVPKEVPADRPRSDIYFEARNVSVPPIPLAPQESQPVEQSNYSIPKTEGTANTKSNLEKFIGENLINKIGIIITIIGVTIGAKYSIEHELISPLMRIVLGYLIGLGLLVFGLRLKKNYTDFSAVLVSGAAAIMYFITFFAYSFYGLMPQMAAFALMVVFTVFTVVAAINYNRQVIAHVGLVGAYAVPFLVSDGTGNLAILFSYMAIINIGILFISIKRYWKPIYYSSFLFTWLIFTIWYFVDYDATLDYGVSLTFLTIFFATFYAIFLGYKLFQKERYKTEDVILLLANSFIFYALGYSILKNHIGGNHLMGLFTIFNALLHLLVGLIIHQQKLVDRNLYYLIMGLFLVFITIAIPVQLDGNWVTLLWAGEGVLLFWIGRTRSVSFYEKISYALMFLAFMSVAYDWQSYYSAYTPALSITRDKPFLNIYFLTSILVAVSFAIINLINNDKRYVSSLPVHNSLKQIMSFSIPALLLLVLYFSFRMEITKYWDQLYFETSVSVPQTGQDFSQNYWNDDLKRFEEIWIINYSLLFFSILGLVNIRIFKNATLGLFNFILGALCVILFLIQGLYSLSELRDSYLDQTLAEYFHRGQFNITIRYISFVFVGVMLGVMYLNCQQEFLKKQSYQLKIGFDLLLSVAVLWIASSELITRLEIMKIPQSYKLSMSLLWGVYSLILIVIGIWKKKKHIRIVAIVLFSVTLIKLFFYDIGELSTILKTIVFVSLGILLLVISFLYNKYRVHISGEND